LQAYRRLNPWFQSIPEAELSGALVLGPASHCRARLAELAASLELAWPVVDLSGLPAEATLRNLEALAPDSGSR
jgi:hypothetical protein